MKYKTRNKLAFQFMRFYRLFSDELYLKILFRIKTGYSLRLKKPSTFSEKIQWLKLYYHHEDLPKIVDKSTAKEYASSLIGDEYIIPTLGIWNTPEEINFDILPNRFVLKTTDGGGSAGVVICKDKSQLNVNETVTKLKVALKQDIYSKLKEWPYKNIKKRILAEELLIDESTSVAGDLNDYKFYCFNGKVTYCEVITGRKTNKTIDFYDLNWNHVDFCFDGLNYSDTQIDQPECFEEMVNVASKLCANKPFCRVDLYVVNKKVYFGEITFYPASGLRNFWPAEWNYKLGNMLTLPNKII